jgi:hypothetical protein
MQHPMAKAGHPPGEAVHIIYQKACLGIPFEALEMYRTQLFYTYMYSHRL